MTGKLIHTTLLLLSVLFSCLGLHARDVKISPERPDLEAIKKAINDRTSPYYYPRLMAEFKRNDTLMKIDKFRHLYLGAMFQEDYDPYRPSTYATFVENNASSDDMTRQQCDTVIKYAELALQDNPLNLKQMINLISALRHKGKFTLANIWQYKLDYLLMAIASTGTGADEENAWYVIEPQHEYVLMNMMGYTVSNHIFCEPYYEIISVSDANGKPAGSFCFNIKTILEEYYRKNPDDI